MLAEEFISVAGKGGITANESDTRKFWTFAKEITSPNTSIKLFCINHQSKNKSNILSNQAYYIGLEQEAELSIWNVNNPVAAPALEEKMVIALAGCPILADKVAQKDKEYDFTAPNITADKKMSVLKKIVDEYNFCEKALGYGLVKISQ